MGYCRCGFGEDECLVMDDPWFLYGLWFLSMLALVCWECLMMSFQVFGILYALLRDDGSAVDSLLTALVKFRRCKCPDTYNETFETYHRGEEWFLGYNFKCRLAEAIWVMALLATYEELDDCS